MGILATLILNVFHKGEETNPFYGLCAMINYDLIFMATGLIDQLYVVEQKKLRDELKESILAPLAFFGLGI